MSKRMNTWTGISIPLLARFSRRVCIASFLLLLSPSGLKQPAFGQSNVRVHSLACRTSSGSAAASESLARLQALPPETPDLQPAITECQAHMEELRKQEESQWTMAIAARDRSDCQTARRLFQGLLQKRTAYQRQARDEMNQLGNCVQAAPDRGAESAAGVNPVNTLQQARGAFNTKNFSLAKSLAQSIASRTDQIGEDAKALIRSIDSIESNNKRYRDANVAITRKQFDKACSLLREIEASDPSFAGLAQAKTRSGGCPVVDTLKPEYEAAKSLLEAKQYTEALDKLKSILAQDPDYEDAPDLLLQAENGIKENMKIAAQREAAAKSPAGTPARQIDMRAALDKTAIEPKKQPDNRSSNETVLSSQNASDAEGELLFLGMDSFYADNHAQARQILGDFAKGKHPPKMLALACFYLGATVITEYYLAGAEDQQKKKEGMLLFGQALGHYRDFSPPWSALSPKIKTVYIEATGRKP
jgi:tetratricopeptide (TPR) repeat protein